MNRTQQKIALITGGNKGIGLETGRQLARQGVHVILTARNPERAEQARQQLQKEGLDVESRMMDVTDRGQIQQTAAWIQEQFGRLDILVNNAGIYLDEDSDALSVPSEVVRTTLETNTLGPLQVTQAMADLLRQSESGRVINVSSGYGELHDMEGGAPTAYKISKTALNAVTRILAGELKPDGVAVDSVCPGWVRTDMGGPSAMRSVEEGASGIVKLALLEKNVPTGGFFRDLQPLAW